MSEKSSPKGVEKIREEIMHQMSKSEKLEEDKMRDQLEKKRFQAMRDEEQDSNEN